MFFGLVSHLWEVFQQAVQVSPVKVQDVRVLVGDGGAGVLRWLAEHDLVPNVVAGRENAMAVKDNALLHQQQLGHQLARLGDDLAGREALLVQPVHQLAHEGQVVRLQEAHALQPVPVGVHQHHAVQRGAQVGQQLLLAAQAAGLLGVPVEPAHLPLLRLGQALRGHVLVEVRELVGELRALLVQVHDEPAELAHDERVGRGAHHHADARVHPFRLCDQ
mmetsp:Transcript_22928/g.37099  ORF Transcript_22928/g.37099 Transcript_22928/m.37099 type:complete len:219 (-) Transcript_22928:1343-1999(-)